MKAHVLPSLVVMGGGLRPSPLRVTLPSDIPSGVKTRSPKALNVRFSGLMIGSKSAVRSAWYCSTVSSKPRRESIRAKAFSGRALAVMESRNQHDQPKAVRRRGGGWMLERTLAAAMDDVDRPAGGKEAPQHVALVGESLCENRPIMLITLDKPSEVSRHCGVVLGEALIVAHQRVGGGELGLNRVGLEVREQKREVADCSKETAPSQLSRRWQVAWERPRTTSVLGRDRSVASCRVDLDLEWRVALLCHRKADCVRQKSAEAGSVRQQAAPAPGDLHAKVGVDALRALVKNKGERVWPVAFKQHLVDTPCALCTAELCAAHQVPSQREGIRKGESFVERTLVEAEGEDDRSLWLAEALTDEPLDGGHDADELHDRETRSAAIANPIARVRAHVLSIKRGCDPSAAKVQRSKAGTHILAVATAAAVDPALLRELRQVTFERRAAIQGGIAGQSGGKPVGRTGRSGRTSPSGRL